MTELSATGDPKELWRVILRFVPTKEGRLGWACMSWVAFHGHVGIPRKRIGEAFEMGSGTTQPHCQALRQSVGRGLWEPRDPLLQEAVLP